MGKSLIFIILLLPASLLQAQDPQERKHTVEVRAGWGAESSFSWADNGGLCFMCCVEPVEPEIDLDEIRPVSNKFTTGPLWAGVSVNLSRFWDVGANFTYDSFWQDYSEGRKTSSYYSLQLMGRVNYINTEWVRLYSSYSIGGHLITKNKPWVAEKTKEWVGDFQFNGIGVSVGKSFFGFTELGLGPRGLISGGIGYRF